MTRLQTLLSLESKAMKHLSSNMTLIYKIIVPTIWTLIVLGLTGFMLWASHNPWVLLTLIMLLPMLGAIRLNWVMYDDHYVFISNGRRQWIYELKQIKSINEGYGTFDPYFELEIYETGGKIRKVDFLPQDQFVYKFTGKHSGNLLELKNKIREAKALS